MALRQISFLNDEANLILGLSISPKSNKKLNTEWSLLLNGAQFMKQAVSSSQ